MSKLTEEHRNKLTPYVQNEELVLARRYSTDCSSKLRVVTPIPNEVKFRDNQVDEVFKGKKGKEIRAVNEEEKRLKQGRLASIVFSD